MSELLPAVDAAYSSYFGESPQHVVRAPGRVNLIGEHTDYNGGFVLPCAIEYHALVAVSARSDDVIEALAIDWQGQSDCFSLRREIRFHDSQMWSNYIRGVVVKLLERGYKLTGCNLAVTGNIPQGAGLSSSAALAVAVIYAVAEVSGLQLDLADIAAIGQAAENDFVGCRCGIMDQMICAYGRKGYAVGIDCRSLELTALAIPESLSVLIINSNVERGLVTSEYNLRRQQCEQAARHFGKTSLRDVSMTEFRRRRGELHPVVAKRAQHVLEENQRVLDMIDAFRCQDISRISELMASSQHSMKHLFDITTPEIDLLVDVVQRQVGDDGGVRMTGGGFGGCVVALLPETMQAGVISAVEREYSSQFGRMATSYRTRPAAGVTLLY